MYILGDKMKVCKQCGQDKRLEDFYKQKDNKDGLHGSCKLCMNSRVKKWYSENPEKAKEKAKKYRETPIGRKRHSDRAKNRKRPYLKHRGAECRRCGFVPENMCQLTVDHIDKNRENNDVGNLQTLCANCHNLKSYVEVFDKEKLVFLNLIPSSGT